METKAPPTADEIIAMDDRPEFKIIAPAWGMTEERPGKARIPDALTFAKMGGAYPDTPEGRVKRNCLMIKECLIAPKFEIHHLEAMAKKNPMVLAQIVEQIGENGKNEPGKN